MRKVFAFVFLVCLSSGFSMDIADTDEEYTFNKKALWTKKDDTLLQTSYYLHSQKTKWTWAEVAADIPEKTNKQCRERWQNHLDPLILSTPLSKEEITLLLNAIDELGMKWTSIAATYFTYPDGKRRTDLLLKNTYHTLVKRQNMPPKQRGTKRKIVNKTIKPFIVQTEEESEKSKKSRRRAQYQKGTLHTADAQVQDPTNAQEVKNTLSTSIPVELPTIFTALNTPAASAPLSPIEHSLNSFSEESLLLSCKYTQDCSSSPDFSSEAELDKVFKEWLDDPEYWK